MSSTDSFNLNLSENVIVRNNSALNGGGLGVDISKADPEDGYTFNINVNGANLTENIATESGGAIFCRMNYNKYNINFNMQDGIVTNNESKKGGAFYVAGCKFIMDGGTIYENTANVDGGALYLMDGTYTDDSGTTYNVECDFTMNNGEIYNNSSLTNNGGAIYVSNGDFTMNGGTIGKIENGTKLGNVATRGGAAYISGGNFTMNGGTIEGNTATNSGGAIQISDGNVYIEDGKIYNNVARGESSDAGYGGGIFVDGGEIVSITGGEISNNVAAKNGGGIEIKTSKVVTVDIYSGKFIDNVADEYGGAVGIECDNGTINVGKKDCDGSETSEHIHPLLSGNMAGIQGGGFYMSGAKAMLNIYCGLIDNNIVVDIENNFDQSNGTVTVFEGVQIGEGNEGIIVVGGTFVDKREENTEKMTIIYYSNFEGSTECKQALVTKGSLITLPGNIFGLEGYSVLGWTDDPSNTTQIEYEAGQILEITDNIELYALWVLEEDNEPSFIIIIPAELSFEKGEDTIVFDVEATLKLFPRDMVLDLKLQEDNFELVLYSNGEQSEVISYKILKDTEEIQNNDSILQAYSDSALITYEVTEELKLVLEGLPKYAGSYEDTFTFIASIGAM